MSFIRFALVGLIVYLIIRSFVKYIEEKKPEPRGSEPGKRSNTESKKVSKEIGEYVDYEDVGK
jgi:large-conductance mechanosensitive channel